MCLAVRHGTLRRRLRRRQQWRWWRARQRPRRRGAKTIDVASMDNAKGNVTYCTGKDTSGAEGGRQGVQHGTTARPDARSCSSSRSPRTSSATSSSSVSSAKSGDCDVFDSDVVWTAEFASQKWLLDMTPYVRIAQGRVRPVDARDGHVRRQDLGRPAADGRRPPLLPQGQGQARPDDVAGGLRAGAKSNDGIVYQGAAYEGLTVRLPRAGLRGRRQGPLRRRQEVRDQLAREPQGAAAHGRRHQGRRGAEGRDDLHGGAVPPRLRGRQVRRSCATGRTPTRSAT